MKKLTRKDMKEIKGYILLGFGPRWISQHMKTYRQVEITEQRIGQIRKEIQEREEN